MDPNLPVQTSLQNSAVVSNIPSQEPTLARKSNKWLFIVVIVILIFILAGIFLYLFFVKTSQSKNVEFASTQSNGNFRTYTPSYIPENAVLDTARSKNSEDSLGRIGANSLYTASKGSEPSDQYIIFLSQYKVEENFDPLGYLKTSIDTNISPEIIEVQTAKNKQGYFVSFKGNKITFVTPDNIQVMLGASSNISKEELIKMANSLK